MSQEPPPAPPLPELLDLSGTVAVVTGGGGNIGAAICRRLAEAGAAVAVHYRSSQRPAEEVAEEVRRAGGKALAGAADLTDADAVERLFDSVDRTLGGLDSLVNNAGIYPVAPLLEMSEREWDDTLDANLKSAFLCTRAAARRMVEHGRGGAIVNVSSIEGELPAMAHSHYSTSKAGMLMHTRNAALELGPEGIRVNAVAPGLIWRPGLERDWPEGVERWRRSAPLGRLGHADEVADACLFLLSPAARWITGATLAVDGGVLCRPVF